MTVGIVQLINRDVMQTNPQFDFHILGGETKGQISKFKTYNCDKPGCYQCENCDTKCDCICYSYSDE